MPADFFEQIPDRFFDCKGDMMAEDRTQYAKLYEAEEYYWGTEPADFLNRIISFMPPRRGMKVLDIGCGEGKDAVYMAKLGYTVTAFDLTESGIAKTQRLAKEAGVRINAYVDDINTFETKERFEIIYSSGTLQYLQPDKIQPFFEKICRITNPNGINYFNVFVEKSFLAPAPDWDKEETLWKTGNLFSWYADWKIHYLDETIFECSSSSEPHFHCMDSILAEKIISRR